MRTSKKGKKGNENLPVLLGECQKGVGLFEKGIIAKLILKGWRAKYRIFVKLVFRKVLGTY